MQKLKPGTRVTMDDGWTGKVFRVDGDFVDCSRDGPNPHFTGPPRAAGVGDDRSRRREGQLEIEADRRSAPPRRYG